MPHASKRKGDEGEREVARELRALLGDADRTGFMQSYRGGFDVMLTHAAVEVKRYAKLTEGMIEMFWRETELQSRQFNLLGVLAYRGDRQRWRYAVPLVTVDGSRLTADYTYENSMHLFCDGFVWWYQQWLQPHGQPAEITGGGEERAAADSRA